MVWIFCGILVTRMVPIETKKNLLAKKLTVHSWVVSRGRVCGFGCWRCVAVAAAVAVGFIGFSATIRTRQKNT